MKIAVVVPVLRRISQKTSYGGIERIASSLVIGAADAGHQVTLYAPFGSNIKHPNVRIRFTTDRDILGNHNLINQAETELFKRLVNDQSEFDLIHTHIEPIIAKQEEDNYFEHIVTPIVVTMHNLTYISENINYYKLHQNLHQINYIFISQDQSKPLAFLPKQTVIYNGIDISEFSYNQTPNKGQLAFLGRITPEKGIVQAISIAKKSNKKLVIAAALDSSQQEFFENQVKPSIDNKTIIFLGEINSQKRDELLRTSEALIFPIQWHEPFGLVIVESMAAGTPVIASQIGSVSEIVEDGKNGFIVTDINNIDEYVSKVSKINQIDRTYCRKTAQEKFNNKIMIDKYLNYYDHIQSKN